MHTLNGSGVAVGRALIAVMENYQQRGRLDRGAGRAAALYGRHEEDRENEIMRILVTNDDGIHAPGLKVCEEIARALSDDVWVVAPETDQSGVSHSLSLNDPLRLREIGEAIRGERHADRLRHHGGAPHHGGRTPDLVLSGVNRGHNVAEDVTYSGTIAGAMEGTMLGIPVVRAVAGLHVGEPQIRTGRPRAHPRRASSGSVLDQGIPRDVLVNVNFPGLPAGRGEGHRRDPGQARRGNVAHRRAP